MTAPVPGGPLRPNTFSEVQTTWAYAYGPARGTKSGRSVTGNGQNVGIGGPLGAIVPINLGLRQSLTGTLEASANVGWVGSGVELRAGTPGGEGPWPFAVSAGLQSSRLAIGVLQSDPGPTYEGRLRLEVYPEVTRGPRMTTRLILSAGASYGLFEHSIAGPPSEGGDVPDLDADFVTTRPETRLELAIGLDLRGVNGALRVAIAPWFLVYAGAPRDRCGSFCGPIDLSQSWGVSFLISPSFGGDLISRRARASN